MTDKLPVPEWVIKAFKNSFDPNVHEVDDGLYAEALDFLRAVLWAANFPYEFEAGVPVLTRGNELLRWAAQGDEK